MDGTSILVETLDASDQQCIQGGTVLNFYQDLNNNNRIDNSDFLLESTVICNGRDGINGQGDQSDAPNYEEMNGIWFMLDPDAQGNRPTSEIIVITRSEIVIEDDIPYVDLYMTFDGVSEWIRTKVGSELEESDLYAEHSIETNNYIWTETIVRNHWSRFSREILLTLNGESQTFVHTSWFNTP